MSARTSNGMVHPMRKIVGTHVEERKIFDEDGSRTRLQEFVIDELDCGHEVDHIERAGSGTPQPKARRCIQCPAEHPKIEQDRYRGKPDRSHKPAAPAAPPAAPPVAKPKRKPARPATPEGPKSPPGPPLEAAPLAGDKVARRRRAAGRY